MALLQQRWSNMIKMGQKNLEMIAEKAQDIIVNTMHHKLYKHTFPFLIKSYQNILYWLFVKFSINKDIYKKA